MPTIPRYLQAKPQIDYTNINMHEIIKQRHGKDVLIMMKNTASPEKIAKAAVSIMPADLTVNEIRAAINTPSPLPPTIEDRLPPIIGGQPEPEPEPGLLYTYIYKPLSTMVNNATDTVLNFFAPTQDGGGPRDPNYTRILSVTLLFALLSFGIYKLIKWFRLRKEEKTVEMLNVYCQEYNTLIKENINFYQTLSNKVLTENENFNNKFEKTVSKAMNITPELAKYSLEADEEQGKTKSIIKKYGYWILGTLAGFVVIGLFAYLGHVKYWGQQINGLNLNAAKKVLQNVDGEKVMQDMVAGAADSVTGAVTNVTASGMSLLNQGQEALNTVNKLFGGGK